MKKTVVILILITLCVLVGCQSNGEEIAACKLIVNGNVIPNTHNLCVNQEALFAELPLLAIAEAMGAQILRESNYVQVAENQTVEPLLKTERITITYNDYSVTLDTSRRDLGMDIPQWMENAVRREKDGELILDSRSLIPVFYHGWMTDIIVDYQENTVYVSTLGAEELRCPEEELDKVNCRLIVNGADITENNYVYINHEEKNAELPVSAIVEALGGSISWSPCQPYPLKDRCIWEITLNDGVASYDTSKSDFGIGYLTDVAGLTRKAFPNEIIVDAETLDTFFYHAFDVQIIVDYKNAVVYVNSLDTPE